MHNLYFAEIYRRGTIFLPLIVWSRICGFALFLRTPVSFKAMLGVFPWDLVYESLFEKTRVPVPGIPNGEKKPPSSTVFSFDTLPTCDGRMDGQMDMSPMAMSRFSIVQHDKNEKPKIGRLPMSRATCESVTSFEIKSLSQRLRS